MNICSYTFEEYVERVRSFHGFAAPGVVIGGFMVDLAYKHLPEGGLFDTICETNRCLPDAIQILTPCTVGNGWLRVINIGRFAISFYNKYSGKGVRISLDHTKLDAWPEIKSWFFKLKPKKEQDSKLLLQQIREAGTTICSIQQIKVDPRFIKMQHRNKFIICPLCKESYPVDDGRVCRACQGESPYIVPDILDKCERAGEGEKDNIATLRQKGRR